MPATDRGLLAEHAAGGSGEAFAELVQRHSGMVYSACRRILGDAHAAQDAAQAVFLVLARKADRLRRDRHLAGWLSLTARQVALTMRRDEARRRAREREAAEMAVKDRPSASWEELRPHLDAALAALPAAQRTAVVLRFIEGRSRAETAREMGCSEESLSVTASRALERLRSWLTRRGVTVPAAALGGLLAAEANSAAAPAALIATLKGLGAGAAAASATAVSLAEGAMKAMMIAKVKLVAAVLGTILVVGGGGGAVAIKLAAGEPAPVPKAAPEELEALKKQLAEGNGKEGRYNSRPEAMCKLGARLAPKELIALLTPFLDAPKAPIEERNTAALVLGKFGGKEAVPVLSAALAKATEARSRDAAYIAALGLGLAASPEAAAPLIQALRGAEPSVRFRAARSLGLVGGEAAEAALIEALEKSDRTTRHAAVVGLAPMAGAKGLEALRKALADEDPLVRRGAAWALLQRKDAAALQAEARKIWDAPVPPPAYKPRNKQLAELAENAWVKLGDSPQEYGQNETQWCYDAANRLLFRQSGCPYSTEAWALDIGTMTWVKRRPHDDFYTRLVEPTVAPWKYSCLVGTCYDPDAKAVRLWGGTWHNHPAGGFDLAADEYVGLIPVPRWTEAYNPVYDPVAKRCISFGGVMAGEMHYWEPASGKVWNQKTATPGPGNNFPRYPTPAAAYDLENKLVVCFTYTSPTGNYSPPPADRGPTETWTYDPATAAWRNAKPAVQPQIKEWGGLAYDSLNHALILSIGVPGKGETWRYDVKANTWTDLKPAGGGPGGPVAYRLCYDPEHNACIGVFSNPGGEKEVWAYRYKSVPVGTGPGAAAR